MSGAFDFEHLVELCRRTHEETRSSAVRAVDRSLVVRNWLFGWYLVKYEQNGVDRANYGAQLLSRVADRFRQAGIKGASTTRLKLYRQFYRQRKPIGPTLSDQLSRCPKTPTYTPRSTSSIRCSRLPEIRDGVAGCSSALPWGGGLPAIVQTLSAQSSEKPRIGCSLRRRPPKTSASTCVFRAI